MSNNQITEMSKVIGQIEDELRDIQSAREQIESVIGANEALSNSLNALFESARSVVTVTEANAKRIIAEISSKVETLNTQAIDIDSHAQQGISKLSEQAVSAQSKFESELTILTQQLMETVSSSTSQSLESVKNGLNEYRVSIDETTQKLTDTASSFLAKQENHVFEIVKLVDTVQESQQVLNQKIDELKQLDVMRLIDEMQEIRKTELETATAAKKWKTIELGSFGVCIVIGLILLVRVFMT
jgi:chromosome segregation ATPase